MQLQKLSAEDWYELRHLILFIKPYRLHDENMREASLRVWLQAQQDGYEISCVSEFIASIEEKLYAVAR
jgi:hypothetical protein